MRLCYQYCLGLCLLVFSQLVVCKEAHVHGEVSLVLATQGKQLLIELESPTANIIGFEHKPQTLEQIERATLLMAQLKNADHLWLLKSAGCVVSDIDIHNDLLHPDKLLQKQPLHDHENEKKHSHHSKNTINTEHNDIYVSYTYHCKSLEKLSEFSTNIFEKFPLIDKVEVQWLISHKKSHPQGSAILTAKKNSITF